MLFGVFGEEAREAVVGALYGVSGVKEVYVNMYQAEAVVTHDGRCLASDLVDAVNAGGQGKFCAQAARRESAIPPANAPHPRDPRNRP